MDGERKTGGTDRILKILTEMFDLTLEQGRRMDQATAEQSMKLTADKLVEICLDCRSRPPIPAIQSVAPPPRPKETPKETKEGEAPKRTRYLLRLVSCKLSSLFDNEDGSIKIDRSATFGVDAYLKRIFEPSVYAHLNEQAKEILEVSGNDDATVLNNIQFNNFNWAFLQNILVRIAVSFKSYHSAKTLFIKDLNSELQPGDPDVGQVEYRLIMGALLFDLFIHAKSGLEGALLDYRYGPKTAKTIVAVADHFGRDR